MHLIHLKIQKKKFLMVRLFVQALITIYFKARSSFFFQIQFTNVDFFQYLLIKNVSAHKQKTLLWKLL